MNRLPGQNGLIQEPGNAEDVLKGDEEKQHQEKAYPDAVDDVLGGEGQGLAANGLQEKEEDHAPVGNGQGQEVEHGEVGIEQGHELQELLETLAHAGGMEIWERRIELASEEGWNFAATLALDELRRFLEQ